MMRRSTSRLSAAVPWAAAVLGALGVLGYQYATRIPDGHGLETARGQDPAGQAPPAPGPTNPPISINPPVTSGIAGPAPDRATSRSPDPQTRAATISALRRALKNSDFASEGQQALASLRTLALNDGDADGAIRDVLREVVYHTTGEPSERAQVALEEIEAQIAASASD